MPQWRKKETSLRCLFALLLLLSARGEIGVSREALAAEPEEVAPININADNMEYFGKESLLVFSGNVVAVQGDSTTTSERMEVTISGEKGSDSIRQIVALENVSFREVDPISNRVRFATGDKAVYSAEEQKVILTGNPKVWEGQNVIVGEKIIFYLNNQRMSVEGDAGLTFYPEREEEQPEDQ